MNRILAITAAALAAVAVGIASYAALKDDGNQTVVRQVTVSGGTPTSTTTAVSAVTNVYNRASKGVVEITVRRDLPRSAQQGQAAGLGLRLRRRRPRGHERARRRGRQHDLGALLERRALQRDARRHRPLHRPRRDQGERARLGAPPAPARQLERRSRSASRVVAIGSPFGLEETVTSGIVSALHREMTAPNNFTIADSIQTDAAINHGNSGGPLLDLNGRVIGVNAQIKSETGENTGVGFAIPSNTVRSIASQLAHRRQRSSTPTSASASRRAANGDGVVLNEIRTGHARREGRPPDGRRHRPRSTARRSPSASALGQAIDAKQPGDTVTLTYTRDGSTHTSRVTLATRPS